MKKFILRDSTTKKNLTTTVVLSCLLPSLFVFLASCAGLRQAVKSSLGGDLPIVVENDTTEALPDLLKREVNQTNFPIPSSLALEQRTNFKLWEAAPAQCYLLKDSTSVAANLRKEVQAILANISNQDSLIKDSANVSVEMFHGSPGLVFEVQFVHGKKIGSVKAVSVLLEDSNLICTHAQLGYRRTLKTLVSKLIEKTYQTDQDELFREVHAMHFNDEPIGFLFFHVHQLPDQGLGTKVSVNKLLPLANNDILAIDDLEIENSRDGKTVDAGVYQTLTNGIFDMDLKLKRIDVQNYEVGGEFEKSSTAFKLSSKKGLVTHVAEAIELSSMLQNGQRELHFEEFRPGTTPNKVNQTMCRFEKKLPKGRIQIEEKFSKYTAKSIIDNEGLYEKTTLTLSNGILSSERIFQSENFERVRAYLGSRSN